MTRGSFFLSVPLDRISSRGSISPRPYPTFDVIAGGVRDVLVTPVLVCFADLVPDSDTLRPPFLLAPAESGSAPPARAPSNTGFFRARSVMDVGGAHVLVPPPILAPRVDDAFIPVSVSPPLSTEKISTVRASHSSLFARVDAYLRGLAAFSS